MSISVTNLIFLLAAFATILGFILDRGKHLRAVGPWARKQFRRFKSDRNPIVLEIPTTNPTVDSPDGTRKVLVRYIISGQNCLMAWETNDPKRP